MPAKTDKNDSDRMEPWLNDCTQGNLSGLGVENVPMTYRGMLISALLMATLTIGGFALLHYWR